MASIPEDVMRLLVDAAADTSDLIADEVAVKHERRDDDEEGVPPRREDNTDISPPYSAISALDSDGVTVAADSAPAGQTVMSDTKRDDQCASASASSNCSAGAAEEGVNRASDDDTTRSSPVTGEHSTTSTTTVTVVEEVVVEEVEIVEEIVEEELVEKVSSTHHHHSTSTASTQSRSPHTLSSPPTPPADCSQKLTSPPQQQQSSPIHPPPPPSHQQQSPTPTATKAMDDEMFTVVFKDVSPREATHTAAHDSASRSPSASNNGKNTPATRSTTRSTQSSASSTPPTTTTNKKKVMVCKHCGREFAYALREMSKHRGECEMFQQKQLLTERAESVKRGNDELEEESSGDNDHAPPMSSDAAPDAQRSDARSSSDDETEDKHRDDAPAFATRSKSNQQSRALKQAPMHGSGGTSIDTDFRVTTDRHGKTSKAECRYCGRVLVYMKGNLHRHAEACSRRNDVLAAAQSAAKEDAITASQSSAPALRLKAAKRKALSDIADAVEPVRATAPSQDASVSGTELSTDTVQTPRRPKRAKHEPAQSPTAASIRAAEQTTPPDSPTSGIFGAQQQRDDSVAKDEHDEAHADPAVDKPSIDAAADLALVFRSVTVEHVRKMDPATRVTWLLGSHENAAAMRVHYREAAYAVHAPHQRFHQLTHELLCDLKTAEMAASVPPRTPFTVFVDAVHHSSSAATLTTESTLEAQAMFDLGLSISFPAPASVTDLAVAPLAHELQVGALVGARAHKATVFCCRAGFVLHWQLYRDDCFMVLLSGSAVLRTQPSAVRFPPCDYSPHMAAASKSMSAQQQQAVETCMKVLCASNGKSAPSSLRPPRDTDADVDSDDSNDLREAILEPGSVLYIPGGTWFEASVVSAATWLEIRIASVTSAELVCDAVRQLCWMDEQWRRPIEQTHDVKAMRQQLGDSLVRLGQSISSLSSFDLLPEEVLLLGDSDALTSSVDAPNNAGADMVVHVDLRRHAFKGGKHIKIFKTTAFRENPLAMLLALRDVSDSVLLSTVQVSTQRSVGAEISSSAVVSSKKKALMQKTKPSISDAHAQQQQRHQCEYEYVVHVNFGSASARSRVRVQFECDALHASVVEWVRKQHGARFLASDAIAFAQTATSDKDGDVAAKYVLRFLATIGFVSPVQTAVE